MHHDRQNRRRSHNPKPKRCSATGKAKFTDWKEAERLLRFLELHKKAEAGSLHTYRCEKCNKIHVGHRVPSGIRREQARKESDDATMAPEDTRA